MGILFYVVALWITGITQGLMWRAVTAEGSLQYSFIETVMILKNYYIVRALGGALYLAGTVLMGYNLWRTARQGNTKPELIPGGNA